MTKKRKPIKTAEFPKKHQELLQHQLGEVIRLIFVKWNTKTAEMLLKCYRRTNIALKTGENCPKPIEMPCGD